MPHEVTDRPSVPVPSSPLERLVSVIERSSALSAIGERMHPIVETLVGKGVRQDVLTGRWLGHPVHPAGVIVPMSCWMASSVLDVAGGRPARRAAQRLVGLGVITAAPVAATGAADWLYTSNAEQRVGTAHAAANNVATLLFAGSWWSRRRHRQGVGVGLGLAGTAVTIGASFLGGHLAYRRGVAVDTTAFQSGPQDWSELTLESPLERGQVARGRVESLSFAVVAGEHDAVHAVESRCTHRGGPLHEGEVDDGCIVCPWHGSRFDLTTGKVVRGPAAAPQPAYETRRDGDGVKVRRSEAGGLRTNVIDQPAKPA